MWLDADAKKVWRQVVPPLRAMGVLTRIDGKAVARYCTSWVRWRRAIEFIREHGEVYPLKDDAGKIRYLQQFPQVAIASRLALELTRLEQEFGMTPASRTRISVPVSAPPRMVNDLNDKSRFFSTPRLAR